MVAKTSPMKRAIKAFKQAMGPQPFQVEGKGVKCSMCGHDQFKRDYIALLMMHSLVCGNCGHVEFFKNEPQSV